MAFKHLSEYALKTLAQMKLIDFGEPASDYTDPPMRKFEQFALIDDVSEILAVKAGYTILNQSTKVRKLENIETKLIEEEPNGSTGIELDKDEVRQLLATEKDDSGLKPPSPLLRFCASAKLVLLFNGHDCN